MTTTVPKESLRTNYFQRGGTSVFCGVETNSSLIWQKNAIISELELSAFTNTGLLLPCRHFEKEVKQHAFINLGLLKFFWNFPATERTGRPGPHFALNLIAQVKELSRLRASDSDMLNFRKIKLRRLKQHNASFSRTKSYYYKYPCTAGISLGNENQHNSRKLYSKHCHQPLRGKDCMFNFDVTKDF
jgi:hypothetical protein